MFTDQTSHAWLVMLSVSANLRTWCYPARAGISSRWGALSKLRVRFTCLYQSCRILPVAQKRIWFCPCPQFNMCCTIEGRADDELDEVALGCVNFAMVQVDDAPKLELQ
jgi:hypothetical protein